MLRILLLGFFSFLFTQSQAAQVSEQAALRLKAKAKSKSFVLRKFKQKLRVCNAFPSDAPLTVKHGSKDLTGSHPLAFKDCKEYDANLRNGDKLHFNLGQGANVGFSVTDMPKTDAVLLLVFYRHDVDSSAVSFESHVFSSLQNSQLALIDTYKGKANSKAVVTAQEESSPKMESLQYNSVVAVRPGMYEVALLDEKGDAKTSEKFAASAGESYVIIRTGVEASKGKVYPEELIVYPYSAASMLRPALLLLLLTFCQL
eukprot:TRINITY_DN80750_c0_g1_i1.p1 TRINITY_DN80750_c0_g1~~TRINITY_DN80750_c0_g1_i1.p1  ORF type:complete len:258 (+),score=52.42 TRINITY_DN80750_c0_g1_i1:158-931(+)